MNTTAEHIGLTPGLANYTCGDCNCVIGTQDTRLLCFRFDRKLNTNDNNDPLRCAECLMGARDDLND